jgi:hypothetical protein
MSWSLSWLRLKNHPGNGTWYETCSVTTLSLQAGRPRLKIIEEKELPLHW